MPISTPLNTNPYYADYSPSKNYYFELFQPGVSVQAREMNNLQLSIQNQIEQMGDNLFANGTIVSGCNFQFYNPYPYAQLNDLDFFNNVVIPAALQGYNVTNQLGLSATVYNFANGFQTTAPNLKTIYVKYINTGSNSSVNLTSFSAGDILTVANPVTNPVELVNVNNGGTGFSNSNVLLAISALQVTQTAGSLAAANGQFISNGNGLTNAQIISVTSTPTANVYILGIAPRNQDLANSAANSQYWSFSVGDAITNPGTTFNATVNQIIGIGMQGNVVTSSVGTIVEAPLTQLGIGYTVAPFITVQAPNNLSGYNTLNLSAQNFLTKLIVATSANSVGNGYAFGVTQGVIYQKGVLLNVLPQQVLIEPYNTNPNQMAVGFVTNETIVTYTTDQSLLDNANGTPNYQAPGANRLMMTPQLVVMQTANAQGNSSFLPLVQWNNGSPYIQNQQTIYNIIGNEIAQGIDDTSGDFVLLPFAVTTTGTANSAQTAQYFSLVVSPGEAYINGFKIETLGNYVVNDQSGVSKNVVNNHTISLNYGNYLIVNNMGGAWQFNTGATVNLYSQAQSWTAGNSLNPSGTSIGSAAMRSLTLYQGPSGTGASQYALYLFNIKMNAGFNFANVASVSYNNGSANVGIADVVQTQIAVTTNASFSTNSTMVLTSTANVAMIQQPNLDQLLFYSGVQNLKNANNISYNYRTTNTSIGIANGNASNATLVIQSPSGLTFPYSGVLSNIQLEDFIVVPTGGDLLYTTATSGTVVVNSSSNTVVANVGTGFLSNLTIGDWVYITANSTGGHSLAQITNIANNTQLSISAAPSFSNGIGTLVKVFPNNVPIPFGYRSGLTANVNAPQNQITFSFAQPFTFAGNTTGTVSYNVAFSNNPAPALKTATRNRYVSMCTSNNAGNTVGPWCLGVPDAFRLRSVYIGNSSVTNTGTNYAGSFLIDTNQNVDFYGLSNLVLVQGAAPPLGSNSYMLVCFDYFVPATTGFYDTVSYLQVSASANVFAQDSQNLATLSAQTFCNTWEVPELFDNMGSEIDLLSYIDFRPAVAGTGSPSVTSTGLPALNPANTVTLSTTGEKFFPVPNQNFVATIEGWEGRIDTLSVDQNGNFIVTTGVSQPNNALLVASTPPVGTMKIVDMFIPPYPTQTTNPSLQIQQIQNTGVISNGTGFPRANDHMIVNFTANSSLPYTQPQVFTQSMIGALAAQLQQLQYYVTLNTLESNTATMTIPSSVVPGQNRQSYGIFTDNFTTSTFSNLTSPEYAALMQNGNIVPEKMLWDVQTYGNPQSPYIQQEILSQDDACVGGINDPLGLGPQCALNLANTVAYKILFRNADDLPFPNLVDTVTVQFANQATVYENITVTTQTIQQYLQQQQYQTGNLVIPGVGLQTGYAVFGNLNTPIEGISYNAANQTLTLYYAGEPEGGQASAQGVQNFAGIPPNVAQAFAEALQGQISWQQFYAGLTISGAAPSGGTVNVASQFYYPPVSFYFYNYTQGVKYDIYQGTTKIASTDGSVGTLADLNAGDIALLTSSAASNWFNDNTQLYMKNFGTTANSGFLTYAGKLSFNYNPANGGGFTIVTTMEPSSINWRWLLAYPIDGTAAGCTPNPVNVNEQNTVSLTPTYTNFTFSSRCGNGATGTPITLSMITGFTATWNNANITPTPTTAIIPFNASADWG